MYISHTQSICIIDNKIIEMNGKKLTVPNKATNSYLYENEFIDDSNEEEEQDDDEQDDDQYSAVSQQVNSAHNLPNKMQKHNLQQQQKKQSIKNQGVKFNQQIGQKNFSQVKESKIVAENKSNSKKLANANENEIKKEDMSNRLSKLNKGMEKLSVSIHEIRDNYEDLQIKQNLIRSNRPKNEQQVRQYLRAKKVQKLKLEERKRAQQDKDNKKLEIEIRLEQEERERRERQKLEQQQRRKRQMRDKRYLQKQKLIQKNKQVNEMYEKIKQKEAIQKKYHFRKEEEDLLKVQEEMQKRKQILAQRKEQFRSIQYSQIEQHKKKHQQIVKGLVDQKAKKRKQKVKRIRQQNKKMEDLYKGLSYDYVLDQIQEKFEKRKQPIQKHHKMKQYQKYVLQNYIPKTHQPSRTIDVVQNRSSLSHKQVKRYRYMNGVAYGQIIQDRPIAKSETQQRQMGKNNLQYVRSLPKKQKPLYEDDGLSPEDIAILDNKLNKIVRVKRERNPLYQGHKSVDLKISKNPTREEVKMIYDQLKSKDEHMKMKQKLLRNITKNSDDLAVGHKRINEQIVKNIEQKLNLLAKL